MFRFFLLFLIRYTCSVGVPYIISSLYGKYTTILYVVDGDSILQNLDDVKKRI
jgi:hypothetical protein